jgi:hypothetical protein
MFLASALSGDLATKNDVTTPTQQDLATNTESRWYVLINQSQNNGQLVGQAPMYYAVQQGPSLTITIHYIFLYAYQGGQTFELGGTAGYMWDLGMHQGDLEISQFSSVSLLPAAHTRLCLQDMKPTAKEPSSFISMTLLGSTKRTRSWLSTFTERTTKLQANVQVASPLLSSDTLPIMSVLVRYGDSKPPAFLNDLDSIALRILSDQKCG